MPIALLDVALAGLRVYHDLSTRIYPNVKQLCSSKLEGKHTQKSNI
jgi:hypothetical protein